MRKRNWAISVASLYFVLSNTVFCLGVTGRIDAFFWGLFSFLGYWPFSLVTRYVWRSMIDNLNIYDSYIPPFKLYAPHVVTYAFDVVLGTLWWAAIVYCALSALSRVNKWRENRKPEI